MENFKVKQHSKLNNQPVIPVLIILIYVAAFIIPIIISAVNGGSEFKAPIITNASSLSYNSIQVEWTEIHDAKGYQIFRYNDESGKFKYVKTIKAKKSKNKADKIYRYVDEGLIHDTGYAYSVRAYKNDFFMKRYSDYSDIASATPELTPSEIISVKNTGNSNIIVYWRQVDGVDGYELYRSEDAFEGYEKIYTTQDSSIVNYTDHNLKHKKTYHYKIRTYFSESNGKDTDTNDLIISDLSGFQSEQSIGKNAEKLEAELREKLGTTIATADSYQTNLNIDGYKIAKSFRVKSYAYSGGGNTATGQKAQVGRIAVDPKVIPLGTWLYVEGYGLCQACDTGGDIIGKTIDVYMNTELECKQWGVRYPMVYILAR